MPLKRQENHQRKEQCFHLMYNFKYKSKINYLSWESWDEPTWRCHQNPFRLNGSAFTVIDFSLLFLILMIGPVNALRLYCRNSRGSAQEKEKMNLKTENMKYNYKVWIFLQNAWSIRSFLSSQWYSILSWTFSSSKPIII